MPGFGVVRTTMLLPVVLQSDDLSDEWGSGPWPFELPDGSRTTTDLRATYFDDRAASHLYGDGSVPRRWSRDDVDDIKDLPVDAVEVVRYGEVGPRTHALLMVHTSPSDDRLMGTVRNLVRIKSIRGKPVAPLRDWVERLPGVDGIVENWGRALTLTYAEPLTTELPAAPMPAEDWSERERWLFLLASSTAGDRFHPSPGQREELLRHRLDLSADWEGLVLRDGVALLAAHSRDEAPFLASAEVYARTIYADAMALGLIQQVELTRLADRLATLEWPTADLERLIELEQELSSFRSAYWWQHVTQHGVANRLLEAFHEQRRLRALMTQVRDELRDYSRQAALRDAVSRRRQAEHEQLAEARTNRGLAILAIVGLPLALGPLVLDLFEAQTTAGVASSVVATVLLFALLILTREARELLRQRREEQD